MTELDDQRESSSATQHPEHHLAPLGDKGTQLKWGASQNTEMSNLNEGHTGSEEQRVAGLPEVF